jgi:hypothetical protein
MVRAGSNASSRLMGVLNIDTVIEAAEAPVQTGNTTWIRFEKTMPPIGIPVRCWPDSPLRARNAAKLPCCTGI